MSIDTSIPPTIRLPRDGRNMSEAVKFVRSNFPAAKALALDGFEIVVHFAKELPSPPVSLEAATSMADSILAESNGRIEAAHDREQVLELLTPAERKGLFDHERRTLFTVGNVYQSPFGPQLVLKYEEGRRWSVTTVKVREVRPGIWRRFGTPVSHATYPGSNARILAQMVAAE